MRPLIAALGIAAIAAGLPQRAVAQDLPVQLEALPSASRDALIAWLERDCSGPLALQEAAQLRVLGGNVPEALSEAYRQGPPPDLERKYTAAFSDAFDARNKALSREGERLFGAQDAARLKAVDRETYVRRRLDAARLNYRANAVLGLGIAGARDSLTLLNQIAEEPGNPLREAARSSIARLEGPDSGKPRQP